VAIKLSGYSFLSKLAIKYIIIALFIISYLIYLVLLFGLYIYKGESLISMLYFFAQI
jgi:hypothetical protein